MLPWLVGIVHVPRQGWTDIELFLRVRTLVRTTYVYRILILHITITGKIQNNRVSHKLTFVIARRQQRWVIAGVCLRVRVWRHVREPSQIEVCVFTVVFDVHLQVRRIVEFYSTIDALTRRTCKWQSNYVRCDIPLFTHQTFACTTQTQVFFNYRVDSSTLIIFYHISIKSETRQQQRANFNLISLKRLRRACTPHWIERQPELEPYTLHLPWSAIAAYRRGERCNISNRARVSWLFHRPPQNFASSAVAIKTMWYAISVVR